MPYLLPKLISCPLTHIEYNSPLGILSPGFQKVGDYFTSMVKDLEQNREEYGCKPPFLSFTPRNFYATNKRTKQT